MCCRLVWDPSLLSTVPATAPVWWHAQACVGIPTTPGSPPDLSSIPPETVPAGDFKVFRVLWFQIQIVKVCAASSAG